MSEKQAEELKKSLEKFDLAEIPAINTDNKIVAGHMRVATLQLLGRGDEEIDVRVPNRKLTDKEYNEYLLRSNQNRGDWDWDILANSFDINELIGAGFDEELSFMFDDVMTLSEDGFDLDKALKEITEHPTQKPITLCEKPMKRCTKPGDIVLDLFGGSGSTLIAAEQLNRKAYIMECDPVFCDVIKRRYNEYIKR